MNRKKYIKTFWNEKFFSLPEKPLKSKITALKMGYLKNKINLINPFLFVCNKTCPFDKFLISHTLNGNFVFLKDWVIQELHEGVFSKENKKELLESFKILKDAYISVVVFPEKNLTLFGNPSHLPLDVTNFLHETDFNIKFLALIGTYFAKPIWSPETRRCETRFQHQFSISVRDRSDLSSTQINEYINNYMPSSASVYSYKFDPMIRSNTKAQNLETLIYCCPNCKKLFTIYSEFNCLKCNDCGSAVECSSNGRISLSSQVSDLDTFAEFQFNTLKNIYFDDSKPMVSYDNINIYSVSKDSQIVVDVGELPVSIYCNKIVVQNNSKPTTYKLLDMKQVELKPDNMLYVVMNNGEKFILHGRRKENLYIVCDLVEVMKQIKN